MYVLDSITYVMPSGLTKEGSKLPLAPQADIKKGSCVFVRLRLNLTNSRIFHRLFENSKEVHLQVHTWQQILISKKKNTWISSHAQETGSRQSSPFLRLLFCRVPQIFLALLSLKRL